MSVDRVGPSLGAAQELMKILQAGQEQTIDLNKKIIKLGHTDKSLQNIAEGKGLKIDLTA